MIEIIRKTGCPHTYRNPSTTSARIEVVRASTVAALNDFWISDRNTAEHANEAASTTKIPSTGMTAIKAPASSGPQTVAAEKLAWIRPFAVTRSSLSTRLGIAANCDESNPIDIVEFRNATA